MKDINLLGNPNYTIRSSMVLHPESRTFLIIKYTITIILSLAAFFFVFNIEPSWGTTDTEKIRVYRIIWRTICGITPFIVARQSVELINYIGEHKGIRYIEKETPVELRLYDDCAVKYIIAERLNTFIQMPYENIQQCTYSPHDKIVSFTGEFLCVSFFLEDNQHTKPIYEKIGPTVFFPVDINEVPEIPKHSPIDPVIRFGGRNQ